MGDIVILCSDGLWGEVTEPEIKEVLNIAPSPLAAAKQLIDIANASGGPDNITAIIIYVSGEGPSQALNPAEVDKSTQKSISLDDTQPSLPVLRPDSTAPPNE